MGRVALGHNPHRFEISSYQPMTIARKPGFLLKSPAHRTVSAPPSRPSPDTAAAGFAKPANHRIPLNPSKGRPWPRSWK
jgi:hypothetical protein